VQQKVAAICEIIPKIGFYTFLCDFGKCSILDGLKFCGLTIVISANTTSSIRNANTIYTTLSLHLSEWWAM
jgi:hypothetical protein